MLVDIDKIKVKERIRKEYGSIHELAEDIKKNGLINPPAINKNYELLAGERRLRACKYLGWNQIPVNMLDTESEEQDLHIEISENEARKEFTMTERLAYARQLAEIESKKAKERMVEAHSTGTQNFAELGETRKKVADAVGINRETLRQASKINENRELFDPEEFKDWDDGKLSTNKLYQKLKSQLKEKQKELEERPEKIIKVRDDEEIKKLKDEIEAQKKDYDFLYKQHSQEIIKNTNLEEKLIDQQEEHQKEIEKLEGSYDVYVKKSSSILVSGIKSFLSTYGGDVWLTDKKTVDKLDDRDRDELLRAVNALMGFAYQINENLKGENEDGDEGNEWNENDW